MSGRGREGEEEKGGGREARMSGCLCVHACECQSERKCVLCVLCGPLCVCVCVCVCLSVCVALLL